MKFQTKSVLVSFESRLMGLMLIGGIFFMQSCMPAAPLQKSPEEWMRQGHYEEALAASDNLEQKTDLLITWRQTTGQEANSINPQSFYRELRTEIDEAGLDSPEVNRKLESLWSMELQEGVLWLQREDSEQLLREEVLGEMALGENGAIENGDDGSDLSGLQYFQWAIDLMPDSVSAYRLKSTAHYKLGQTGMAVQTLEALRERAGLNDELMEKLAYLYLESGRLAEATELYLQLQERDPENRLWNHGFVNALILAGESEQAIGLLEELISREPSYLPYRKTMLAEQVKLRISPVASGVRSEVEQEAEMQGAEAEETVEAADTVEAVEAVEAAEAVEAVEVADTVEAVAAVADDFLDNAFTEADFTEAEFEIGRTLESLQEVVLNQGVEEDPQSMGEYFTGLGNLLHSAGSNGSPLIRASLVKLRNQLYEAAIPYWVKMREIDPENQRYARQLYLLYTELSMIDEAEMMNKKLNF